MNERKVTTPSRIAALRWEGDFSASGLIPAATPDAQSHSRFSRRQKILRHDPLRFFVSRRIRRAVRCRRQFALHPNVNRVVSRVAQILYPMLERGIPSHFAGFGGHLAHFPILIGEPK